MLFLSRIYDKICSNMAAPDRAPCLPGQGAGFLCRQRFSGKTKDDPLPVAQCVSGSGD